MAIKLLFVIETIGEYQTHSAKENGNCASICVVTWGNHNPAEVVRKPRGIPPWFSKTKEGYFIASTIEIADRCISNMVFWDKADSSKVTN